MMGPSYKLFAARVFEMIVYMLASVSNFTKLRFYADVPLHDTAKIMNAIKSDEMEVST